MMTFPIVQYCHSRSFLNLASCHIKVTPLTCFNPLADLLIIATPKALWSTKWAGRRTMSHSKVSTVWFLVTMSLRHTNFHVTWLFQNCYDTPLIYITKKNAQRNCSFRSTLNVAFYAGVRDSSADPNVPRAQRKELIFISSHALTKNTTTAPSTIVLLLCDEEYGFLGLFLALWRLRTYTHGLTFIDILF
jgi:hypothetical protein